MTCRTPGALRKTLPTRRSSSPSSSTREPSRHLRTLRLPAIFVLRVPGRQIVASRDYAGLLGVARALGKVDEPGRYEGTPGER